jgi:hypothetical protein
MRFSTITAAMLLPFVAMVSADSTTTSTATMTKTITVMKVVATETSTYSNVTMQSTGAIGTTSMFTATAAKTGVPAASSTAAFKGAAPRLDVAQYGAAGLVAMVVAAML